MTREEIDRLLESENAEVLEAHSNIIAIQKDKDALIKLGQDWLDSNLIGGLNNKILFLGSRPGNGKTFHCSRTINNLLDREINPLPIKVLRVNLEMSTEALLLREICKTLGKKPSEVLKNPYSESERPLVTKVVNSFRDSRVQNFSHALKGEDYRYMLQKFVAKVDREDGESKVKTKKVVLTDHLHCYLTKETIDTILTIQNEMKMQDSNLSFINYFQLNRDTENLWKDTKDKKTNPRNMLPTSSCIYLTDMLQMYADVVVAMVIPQVYDMDEYVAINKERNIHLQEHFVTDSSDNFYARVKGRNRIYYNFMKIRMVDDFDDPKIFCEVLNPANEDKVNQIMEEKKAPTITPPTFNTVATASPPTFFSKALEDARGSEFDDNPPF